MCVAYPGLLRAPLTQSIEVARLTKARPLDNLEFMQWFKAYFDGITNNQPITDYDGTHACFYGGETGRIHLQGRSAVIPHRLITQMPSNAHLIPHFLPHTCRRC